VRMAQPFSLRHPLIDFHGNYGSPDFGPAAERYTECRLAPLAMQLLADIDENTVDMMPNYDGRTEEPTVLPSRFPNLLVNGSQGIAVGMATNIPPQNLGETIDATVHLIDNPDATPDDLMQFIKGPDFPTGASILGRAGIIDAYRTGRGSIKLRATATIERPLPYPRALDTPQSTTAGMVVRWAPDAEAGPSANIHYLLRWETLESNRDMPRDPIPPPTRLRLYGFQ